MLISHLIYCHFRQTSQMLPLPADFSYAATPGRLFTCCHFRQTSHMLPLPADFSYAATPGRLFTCCHFPGTLPAVSYYALPLHVHACISTPVGLITWIRPMFKTKLSSSASLISLLGCEHWYTHTHSIGCRSTLPEINLHIQSHSWNCSIVRLFLARTYLAAVTHNRIILPHLPCMGHH